MTRPDFFERAQIEQNFPHFPQASEFEMMSILRLALLRPRATKRELVDLALTYGMTERRLILRCIDSLVSLQYLHRNDFRYEVTTTGRRVFEALRIKNDAMMRLMSFGGMS